jgi:hypothetical protein
VLFGDWVEDYVQGHQHSSRKYEDAWHRFSGLNEINAGSDRNTSRLWNTLLFWHGLSSAQTKRWDDAL